jgi:hypothetical protein
MTAADEYLRASPTWLQAIRHPFRQGEALTWMPSRKLKGHVLAAVIAGVVGFLFFLVTLP